MNWRQSLINIHSIRDRLEATLVGKLIERLGELNALERSLALGSKLFTTVVPLSILVSALLGGRDLLATRLIDGFGLSGAGANAIRSLFDVPAAHVGDAINLIGVVVLGYSLISFAQALQRTYEAAWRLPPLRTVGIAWGGVWVIAFAVYFSLSTPLAGLLYQDGFRVSGTIVTLITGILLWMVTPFILLGRRVRLRVLLPGGVASAVVLTAFNVGSNVYLPRSMTVNVGRYGLVGVTLTLLSWLFLFSLTLVVSAACGAVLGERRTDRTDPRESGRAMPPEAVPDADLGESDRPASDSRPSQ